MDKSMVGLIGESFLVMELAKRNIRTYKLPPQFDYDFLLSNNLKIEVKTARLHKKWPNKKNREGYKRFGWQFTNQKISTKRRLRKCDFYVLICLDEELKELKVKKIFVVPSKIIGDREGISVPEDFKLKKTWNGFSLKEYENRWDLITEKSSFT